jgi:hypothetical protein
LEDNPAMTDSLPTTCAICADPLTPNASATCIRCDRPFHLRLRNDAEGKDCGDVWINEQYLSLEFSCFECLGATEARGSGIHPDHGASPEPPVGSGH